MLARISILESILRIGFRMGILVYLENKGEITMETCAKSRTTDVTVKVSDVDVDAPSFKDDGTSKENLVEITTRGMRIVVDGLGQVFVFPEGGPYYSEIWAYIEKDPSEEPGKGEDLVLFETAKSVCVTPAC